MTALQFQKPEQFDGITVSVSQIDDLPAMQDLLRTFEVSNDQRDLAVTVWVHQEINCDPIRDIIEDCRVAACLMNISVTLPCALVLDISEL